MKKILRASFVFLLFALLFAGLTLLGASATCKVNGNGNYKLPAAVEAASDGDTITLTANETLSANLTISKTLTIETTNGSKMTLGSYALTFSDNANVTFNNFNITGSGAKQIILASGGAPTVTLNETTITSTYTGSGGRALIVSSGTLNLNDCQISATGGSDMRLVWANGVDSKANVSGGSLVCNGAGRCLVGGTSSASLIVENVTCDLQAQNAFFAESAASITSRGNTVTKAGSNTTSALFDCNTAGTVLIDGGTYTSVSFLFNCRNAGLTLNLTDGTFSGPIAFTLSAPATVSISGNTAITATATSSPASTVSAAANITLSGAASITANATSGSVFSISANATLTMQDSAKIIAVNDTAITTTASPVLNLNGGSITAKGYAVYTKLPDGGAAQTPAITIDGTAITSAGNRALLLSSSADLIIKSGSVTSDSGFAVWSNTAKGSIVIEGGSISAKTRGIGSSSGSTITVSGGEIYTEKGYAIFTESVNTTVTVSGGTIRNGAEGVDPLIYIRPNATLIISGGDFYAAASQMFAISGTGTITGGTFIGAGSPGSFINGNAPALSIYGGYFQSNAESLIVQTSNSTLSIYGGTFVGGNATTALVRIGTDSSFSDLGNIYGGTYIASNASAAVFQAAQDSDNTRAILYAYNAQGGKYIRKCGSGASSANNVEYPPLFNRYVYNSISVESGAAVRTVKNSSGIRFVSTISAGYCSMLENAKMADTAVEYGTIILPADYLKDGTTFAPELLRREGKTILEIPAVEGMTVNDDGSITICASMINVREYNYKRAFCAIVYAKYTARDGAPTVHYSAPDATVPFRSIAGVARLAYRDVKVKQDAVYQYATGDGTFSPYTSAQREVLAMYFDPDEALAEMDIYILAGDSEETGYSSSNDAFAALDEEFTKGYSNVLVIDASNGNLNPVPAKITGDKVGVELGMAKLLSEYYNEETGKVACIIKVTAKDAHLLDIVQKLEDDGETVTTFGNFAPPSFLAAHGANSEELSGYYYKKLVQSVIASYNNFAAGGYESIAIKGIVFMQGAADSTVTELTYEGETLDFSATIGKYNYPVLMTTAAYPYSYSNMFVSLVKDLRADLESIFGGDLSALPFVTAEIPTALGGTNAVTNSKFITLQDKLPKQGAGSVFVLDSAKLAPDASENGGIWGAEDLVLIGQMAVTSILNAQYGYGLAHPATLGDPLIAVYNSSNKLQGTYSHLTYALNSIPSKGSAILLGDVSLTSGSASLSTSYTVTLNGNNHVITSANDGPALRVIAATLTLNNVAVTNSSTSENAALISVHTNATLTLPSGTYEAAGSAFALDGSGAVMNINGGTLTGRGSGAAVLVSGEGATLTVNSGTFNAHDSGAGVEVSGLDAKATLKGGTFNVYNSGAGVRTAGSNSTLTLNGGTFNAYNSASGVVLGSAAQNFSMTTPVFNAYDSAAGLALETRLSYALKSGEFHAYSANAYCIDIRTTGPYLVLTAEGAVFETAGGRAIHNPKLCTIVVDVDLFPTISDYYFPLANYTLRNAINAVYDRYPEVEGETSAQASARLAQARLEEENSIFAPYTSRKIKITATKSVAYKTLSGSFKVTAVTYDPETGEIGTGDTTTLKDPKYTGVQGGCFDGSRYYYLAMLSNGGLSSIYPDYYSFIILKYDVVNKTVVSYSTPRDLDHANDITYNPNTKELFVVHNQPNAALISVFNAETMAYKRTFTIGFNIYGLHYNPERNQYVAARSGGENMAVMDANFNHLYSVRTIQTQYTTQGIYADANYVYFLQHNRSCIMVYDWDGNFVEYIKGPDQLNASGYEGENLHLEPGKMYICANTPFSYNNLYSIELVSAG